MVVPTVEKVKPRIFECPGVLSEKQAEFYNSFEFELLYGGAAGGGKSEILLKTAISEMLLYRKNRGILLRESYPELERSLIMRALEVIPPEIARYHEGKKRFYFYETDSYLEFGYLETDGDCRKYQSAAYGFIGIDELTHQSEYRYRYMLSRCRAPQNPKIIPKIRTASNPGNVGHSWVKKRFRIGLVEPGTRFMGEKTELPPDFPFKLELKPLTRKFIPAKVWDNPWIIKNDPIYLKRLLELPELERRMLLDGSWEAFKGQAFPEWNYDIHTCEPFDVPEHWPHWRGIDPGYHKPLCVLWFALDPDREQLFVINEIYEAGLIDKLSGAKIKKMSRNNVEYRYTVCGPDAWSKRGESGQTVAETWIKLGIPLIKADKSKGSRVAGKMRVHDWLQTERLRIFRRRCPNLIRTLPDLIYKKVGDQETEDVDDKGEDHSYEALKDFLMTRPKPKRKIAKPFVEPTLEEKMWAHLKKRCEQKGHIDEHLGNQI